MLICTKCGSQLNDDDRFCPKCGTPVAPQPQAPEQSHWAPAQPVQPAPDAQQPKKTNVKLIAAVVAAVIVVAGVCCYFVVQSHGEQQMWEQCENSTDTADFEKYIDAYPDGDHIAEVKAMYAKLKADGEAWNGALNSGDAASLRSYLSAFPNGVHAAEARQRLDDAVWNEAQSSNSSEAYLAYMQEFPSGSHYQDAVNAYNKIQSTVMTDADQDNVRASIEQFLAGIEAFDSQMMLSACAPRLVNFMGKRATAKDVADYIAAYRNSDISAISFSGLSVQTQKSADQSGAITYKAVFTVDRRFEREQVEKGTLASMRGTAVLNSDYKITAITMNKTAEY